MIILITQEVITKSIVKHKCDNGRAEYNATANETGRFTWDLEGAQFCKWCGEELPITTEGLTFPPPDGTSDGS